MLLRAALIVSLSIVTTPLLSLGGVAKADGIERPRVERPAPRPRARPAPRPAPRAEAPPPQIIERVIIQESNEMKLSDGFFSGPLAGGVGFGMDAGSGLGGGATIISGGGARASVFVQTSVKVFGGGGGRVSAGCCH